MATLKQYRCKGCGYEVNACSEGHGLIMTGKIAHFLCKSCQEIVDVYTTNDEEPQNPVCPKCGSKDLERWNPVTGKCPKCGGKMKIDKRGEVMYVD
jgi:DNA-directed RNA polymerase subunit RPC12/RpoP